MCFLRLTEIYFLRLDMLAFPHSNWVHFDKNIQAASTALKVKYAINTKYLKDRQQLVPWICAFGLTSKNYLMYINFSYIKILRLPD